MSCTGTVNRELIASLVGEIREDVLRAKELASRPFEELSLYERLALRYLVIELVEASATICIHLLRKLYGIEAEGYPQCFLKLGRLGLIPASLAQRLAGAARLCNLLVHRYWEVDDKRLLEAVRRGLRDFEEFARIVEEAVEK